VFILKKHLHFVSLFLIQALFSVFHFLYIKTTATLPSNHSHSTLPVSAFTLQSTIPPTSTIHTATNILSPTSTKHCSKLCTTISPHCLLSFLLALYQFRPILNHTSRPQSPTYNHTNSLHSNSSHLCHITPTTSPHTFCFEHYQYNPLLPLPIHRQTPPLCSPNPPQQCTSKLFHSPAKPLCHTHISPSTPCYSHYPDLLTLLPSI